MLEELEYNLWEHILSRLVDYGHAFSPEIEMAALQGDEALLLHGEAVNIDMALTTQVNDISTWLAIVTGIAECLGKNLTKLSGFCMCSMICVLASGKCSHFKCCGLY